jgi:hypothetical protein
MTGFEDDRGGAVGRLVRLFITCECANKHPIPFVRPDRHLPVPDLPPGCGSHVAAVRNGTIKRCGQRGEVPTLGAGKGSSACGAPTRCSAQPCRAPDPSGPVGNEDAALTKLDTDDTLTYGYEGTTVLMCHPLHVTLDLRRDPH